MKYIGSELELFKLADRWKSYWKEYLEGNLKGDILDVGSGICSNLELLLNNEITQYTGIEPDDTLLDACREKIRSRALKNVELINGTINNLDSQRHFDFILYIDVLEHIENDQQEIEQAISHLKEGASIFILAPAHNFLFSAFDCSVGHYRRYDKKSIRELFKVTSKKLIETRLIYLDSLGMLTSLANKFILRQAQPKKSQIVFWDKVIIPISRIIDFFTCYKFGKSILAIYTKL